MNERTPRSGGRRIHPLSPKQDVERELRFHLAQRAEELIARGWEPADARAEAQRLFGDYGTIRSESAEIAARHARHTRRSRMWGELSQDLRYAVRGLTRAPGFALLAIVTLALGIGANSAAFAIVNGVLLAPLPYPAADRLVALWEVSESGTDIAVTWPNFKDVQAEAQTLSAVAAYQNSYPVTVLGGMEPVRAPVSDVTASLFDVLGVAPERGRLFAREDLVVGGAAGVLVSESFWRDQLGSPADLSSVTLDVYGSSAQVIGVMPGDFDFPRGTAIWYPLDVFDPGGLGTRTAHNFRAVARLAPGTTAEAARQELNGVTQRIREREAQVTALAMSVYDLRDDSVGDARRALLLLLGTSGFVLLVACTNLASALLARAERRRHELAIRASLGAHRLRLVRQLLTESVLLAALGACAGLAVAAGLIRMAIIVGPDAVPRLDEVQLDGWVLAFTTLLAIATALTFGTVPALRATKSQPYDTVREGGRGTASAGRRRAWSLLVGAEVALALLLLVGSGLLIRSFYQLTQVDPGFDIEQQLTVQLSLPESKYEEGLSRSQYYDQLLDRIRALPAVEHAAITRSVPLVDFDKNGNFDIEGGEMGEGYASYRVVSPDFFAAMGTPILRGRGFTTADRAGARDVIVVNDRLAREFFSGVDPIGRRIRTMGMDSRGADFATIVGVVGDVRARSLDSPPVPAYYLAFAQRTDGLLNTTLVVRGRGRTSSLVTPVRDAIRDIDTDVAMDFGTLREGVGESLADRRFTLLVLGVFAGIALLLSGVGIYGVVAFAVAQRTREIGVRMALGAAASSVLWTVSRSTMLSVAMGIVLGLVGAAWLSRLLAALLYEVDPLDPLTFAVVAVLLFAVAWVAVLVPARRAMRVSPMAALGGD
ncbi:MAG: ADOP family duplicated permease [Longimicrobiales bacterium]